MRSARTPRSARRFATSSCAAAPGELLAVDGSVLDRRADPGHLLLNGSQAARSTPLADGDTIRVEDGTDRVEGTKTSRDLIPGQRTSNPMFTLDTTKVVRITTVGRISGTAVSVRYRPIGPVHRPPQVALTFDDGPWPSDTRRVLTVLERMKARQRSSWWATWSSDIRTSCSRWYAPG